MGNIKYNRDHVKQVKMNLNLRTDADIIGHLSGKSNVQGYIKELIRNNMKEEKTMASRIFYRGYKVGEDSNKYYIISKIYHILIIMTY